MRPKSPNSRSTLEKEWNPIVSLQVTCSTDKLYTLSHSYHLTWTDIMSIIGTALARLVAPRSKMWKLRISRQFSPFCDVITRVVASTQLERTSSKGNHTYDFLIVTPGLMYTCGRAPAYMLSLSALTLTVRLTLSYARDLRASKNRRALWFCHHTTRAPKPIRKTSLYTSSEV